MDALHQAQHDMELGAAPGAEDHTTSYGASGYMSGEIRFLGRFRLPQRFVAPHKYSVYSPETAMAMSEWGSDLSKKPALQRVTVTQRGSGYEPGYVYAPGIGSNFPSVPAVSRNRLSHVGSSTVQSQGVHASRMGGLPPWGSTANLTRGKLSPLGRSAPIRSSDVVRARNRSSWRGSITLSGTALPWVSHASLVSSSMPRGIDPYAYAQSKTTVLSF